VVKKPTPLSSLQSQDQRNGSREYRIHPGDVLEIKFLYSDEFNENIAVRPDGRISLQLAHDVMAAGRTTAELTDQLVKHYEVELRQPHITVIVRTFSSQKAYVAGEVRNPQLITLETTTTVLQAISQARGFKETARTSEVILIRRNEMEKAPMAVPLDISKVIDGTDMSQDVSLMPSDIVFVPRSHIANINLWVDQYIRKVLPIDIYYNLYSRHYVQ
jgi:protein involved in polysaccharide export with SLBB domain